MKNVNVPVSELSPRRPYRYGQRAPEIDVEPPADIANVDLVELYVEIEYALPSDRGMFVQFVQATSGFASEQIANDMAWSAVSVLGKRVLLMNYMKSTALAIPKRLTDTASEGSLTTPGSLDGRIVKVRGIEMYLTDLDGWRTPAGALIPTDEIDGQIERLRTSFDMVVMIAPPADSNPLGAIMARYADGNIIIVEAEETRQSEAIRLRELLTRSGRPVIGAVLNGKRSHIPYWLARRL